MAKGGLARQRYLEKVNYNQQVAQVNQLYQARLKQGEDQSSAVTRAYSKDEIAALRGGVPSTYTVKDGDNLQKISSNTGTTPDAILNANPEMKVPQTGMVLNTPPPPSNFTPYAQGGNLTGGNMTGGLGLPKPTWNGGINNPTYTQGEKTPGVSSPSNFGQQKPTPGGLSSQSQSQAGGGYSQYSDITGGMVFLPGQNPALDSSLPKWKQPSQPAKPTVTTPTQTGKAPDWAAKLDDIMKSNMLDKLTAEVGTNIGRIPTDWEMQMLVENNRVKPMTAQVPQSSYGGGGYSYRRYSGGYGGGGGGRGYSSGGGGYYNAPRKTPAFSSNSGFRGLVNWRL